MIDLPNKCYVQDCVLHAVNLLNQKLSLIDLRRQLPLTTEDYQIFTAKSDGRPYFDFPSFAMNQKLNSTGLQQFCLVEKKYREEFESSDSEEESELEDTSERGRNSSQSLRQEVQFKESPIVDFQTKSLDSPTKITNKEDLSVQIHQILDIIPKRKKRLSSCDELMASPKIKPTKEQPFILERKSLCCWWPFRRKRQKSILKGLLIENEEGARKSLDIEKDNLILK